MSKNVAGCGETILLSLFGFNLLSNHNWYIDIVHPVGLFLLIVNSRIMLRHSSLQLVPRRLCNIHTMSILNHIAC